MLSRFLDDAYMTFLSSPVNCCLSTEDQTPVYGFDKSMKIEHQQPRLIPSPIFVPQESPATRNQEWTERTRPFASRASSRGRFPVKANLDVYNGLRRPQIGWPTDFRHLDSAVMPRNVIARFRPLELSIYTDNQLSPILPHLGDNLPVPKDDSSVLSYPPPAVMSRSDSAMTFTIPRKPVRSSSRSSSEWTAQFKPRPDSLTADELLAALEHQLPIPARLRSLTEPPSYDRVKSALYERHQLVQKLKDIEETIEERKSIYFSSRPTSRASRPESIYLETNEPMPSTMPDGVSFTPATIVPFASSSASRAAQSPTEQRPQTAPSKTVNVTSRLNSITGDSATFTALPSSSTSAIHVTRSSRMERPLPPPPLPLILQAAPPPLRKKKSSASVSKWLFPSSSHHTHEISLDSVTNSPQPITSRQGFYQCVDFQASSRHSMNSVLSTISTIQSTLDEPVISSTWTPESSPRSDMEKLGLRVEKFEVDEDRNESIELGRVPTFSEKEESWTMELVLEARLVPGRNSVGVAF